ncbi:hypothetical protein [Salinisphaera hydrothermalis]|uniref:Lipoprotein n=1 Tax=Salinisphaera hydrothermalis (strain C41B8) TaxID=1304275 RepID=A0A084IKE0_SALHC|nr:hypothetical protein [Salinisphaera hydrothermalis]KEZ77174.1 hypothetical protein C41B8_11313 [Salinisphaera hydrothermalis C41B8]
MKRLLFALPLLMVLAACVEPYHDHDGWRHHDDRGYRVDHDRYYDSDHRRDDDGYRDDRRDDDHYRDYRRDNDDRDHWGDRD